jgi:hypothetical protein
VAGSGLDMVTVTRSVTSGGDGCAGGSDPHALIIRASATGTMARSGRIPVHFSTRPTTAGRWAHRYSGWSRTSDAGPATRSARRAAPQRGTRGCGRFIAGLRRVSAGHALRGRGNVLRHRGNVPRGEFLLDAGVAHAAHAGPSDSAGYRWALGCRCGDPHLDVLGRELRRSARGRQWHPHDRLSASPNAAAPRDQRRRSSRSVSGPWRRRRSTDGLRGSTGQGASSMRRRRARVSAGRRALGHR